MTRLYTVRAFGTHHHRFTLMQALNLIAELHYRYPGSRISLTSQVH